MLLYLLGFDEIVFFDLFYMTTQNRTLSRLFFTNTLFCAIMPKGMATYCYMTWNIALYYLG